jgi:hypothetical protein
MSHAVLQDKRREAAEQLYAVGLGIHRALLLPQAVA